LVTTPDIVSTAAVEPLPPRPLPPAPAMPAPVPPAPVKPAAKPAPSVSEHEQRRAHELLRAACEREFRPAGTNAASLKFRCECPRADVRRVLAAPSGQIRFDQAQLVAGGPQPLTAWWTNADGERESVLLQVWVQQTPQVLGVKHAVTKGEVLQVSDLEGVPAKEGVSGLTRLGDVVGKEATRALRPGQTLQAGDVASMPLVRTNEIVTVLVRRPGLVVRRQFKATTSGALQETITLVALDDPRTKVQAVVTGYHEATMVSPDAVTEAAAPAQVVSARSGGGAP
jgi:flagella basal body P-ring formation protein FlgA